MRLLNAQTKELRLFNEDEHEPYAILSHTWGPEEITLQELTLIVAHGDQSLPHPSTSKTGYHKIEGCCNQAKENGLKWVWVDTCCIDKTNSVELSEAINSMYRWYQKSCVCYVYLDDVSSDDTNLSSDDLTFRKSRWFTRGWTLQELIAPRNVLFFSNSWSLLGSRSHMEDLLEEISGIPFNLLSQFGLLYFSTAQRMCWAARRETTRKEDMAYCLLGIFGVNMTLSYGEGYKAFRRLQEEIIRRSTDQTIFAWGLRNSNSHGTLQATYSRKTTSILANYPSDFVGCEDMVSCEFNTTEGFEITHQGIRTELRLRLDHVAILDCYHLRDIRSPVHIQLIREDSNLYFVTARRFLPRRNNFLMSRSAKPRPAPYLMDKYMPVQRKTVILRTCDKASMAWNSINFN